MSLTYGVSFGLGEAKCIEDERWDVCFNGIPGNGSKLQRWVDIA